MKVSKLDEKQDKYIQTLINTISIVKKIDNRQKFNEEMQALIIKSKTMPLSTIQGFSILFYSFYNHLTCKNLNKNIKIFTDLSNYMINNLKDINILSFIQGEISKYFSNDFNKYKIFEKVDKDDYEISFLLCLL